MSIPKIVNDNGIPTLYVNDEPFFALAGELHNSSTSSLDYMEEKVWPMLEGLNMNAVIAPIYWETIEPVEGRYDFTLLDGLIAQAEKHDMKLILLWFGLWKNAESMYVPGWMKQDSKTYFRVRKVSGEQINTISPLCQAAVEKDADCFEAIMAHLKRIDEEKNTVIVMQVENEIGVLGSDRDYCDAANKAFGEAVPEMIAELTGKTGTWSEVYGPDAAEAFMAYSFAAAVAKISQAGQAEYPLPCYANAWLKQYPWYPGSYPSGGPVCGVHDIWHAAAPNLFTFGPDIYVSYVADVMDEYSHEGNPLFIPEVRKDAVTASYCMYAFGKHNAICYSPFGIEDIAMDPNLIDRPPMEVMIALNIDPTAFDIADSKDYLAQTYSMIREMKPLYLKYRGTDRLQCWCRHGENDFGTFLHLKNYDLSIAYAPRMSAKPLGAGMIYELEDNKFLIAGMMSTFTFMPKPGVDKKVEILKMEEGTIQNGTWVPGRIMNGDEKMMIRTGEMPGYVLVELFRY